MRGRRNVKADGIGQFLTEGLVIGHLELTPAMRAQPCAPIMASLPQN
jgi:hypothetical protein